MSKLTDELRAEHAEIFELLLKAKVLGIHTEHGQESLLSARNRLLSHLEKEDRELYPALRTAADRDGDLRHNLEFLARDMEKISSVAVHFFRTYTKETLNDRKRLARRRFRHFWERWLRKPGRQTLKGRGTFEEIFLKDFERLYHLLLDRIRREEDILYSLFDTLGR